MQSESDFLSIPPIAILRPTVDIPDNLPEGVQEQVNLFLADYPRTGPAIVKRYLALVLSEKYRATAMGRSENQLQYPNRTKESDGRKKDNCQTGKKGRSSKQVS